MRGRHPRDFVFSAVPGRGLETRSAAGRSAHGQPPSGPRVPLGSRPVPDPALSRTPRVSPGPNRGSLSFQRCPRPRRCYATAQGP